MIDKYKSRKWILVIAVTLLAVVGAFIPPIASLFLSKPLAILTGTQFVSLISLVVGAYFGANAYQNRGYYLSQSNEMTTVVEEDEEEAEV